MLKRILYAGVLSKKSAKEISYSLRRTMASNQNCESEIRLYDFDDLKKAIKNKNKEALYLVDVRENEEVKETGLMPGAIHVPLGQVESAFSSSPEEFQRKYNNEKPNYNDQLVFSCRSGKRSFEAAKIAVKLSYENVGSYKGGWLEWAEKSKECENA